MYASFKGNIDEILKDKIVIEVNNIGYEIYMPESEMDRLKEKQEIKVFTYLQVREDDMKLFGFLSKETLGFFKKLISVSGVGPKVALGIISNVDTSDMCVAIATENVAALKAVPGIGPKMAQKIVFELKDKVLKEQIEVVNTKISKVNLTNSNVKEAITALQVLGYTEKQIKEVMNNIEIKDDSVEIIIRKVLKEMQNM